MLLPSDLAPVWMRHARAFSHALLALDIGVPIMLPAHLRRFADEGPDGEPLRDLAAFVASVRGKIVWYQPAS